MLEGVDTPRVLLYNFALWTSSFSSSNRIESARTCRGNEQGCVLRCDDHTWAATPVAARQNGWTHIDGTACEISAGDAETLAAALEEAGSDMAEPIELCTQGALFIQ